MFIKKIIRNEKICKMKKYVDYNEKLCREIIFKLSVPICPFR